MGVAPATASAIRSPRARYRIRLVFNANASCRSIPPLELLTALRDEGADVQLEQTRTAHELAALLRVDDGRRLVLVGGDGTLHAAANADAEPREIALIPAGRANNVARSLGIPCDWKRAAELAVRGAARPIDLIEARSERMRRLVVEGVSVGFLAQARVRYHGRNSADLVAGARAGAAALAGFHPFAARVGGPDGSETLHIAQLFVANLPLYEFGLRVAPHADPTDATLDLVAIDAASRLDVVRMIVELRRGTHLNHPNVRAWRAPSATIDSGGASPIIADSTDLGPGPVRLRAVPAALRLVRP
jgi:diacylglycerol kinase (ATP)